MSSFDTFIRDRLTKTVSTETIIPASFKPRPSRIGPYGFSSFSYSLLGFYVVVLPRLWTGMYLEGCLVIFQGLASYMCDVYTFGVDSKWKVPVVGVVVGVCIG